MTPAPDQPELPARFEPLRPPIREKRRVALLFGSGAWLIALAVLAVVVDRRNAVELALVIVAASLAAGLLSSGWMRRARVKEERDR